MSHWQGLNGTVFPNFLAERYFYKVRTILSFFPFGARTSVSKISMIHVPRKLCSSELCTLGWLMLQTLRIWFLIPSSEVIPLPFIFRVTLEEPVSNVAVSQAFELHLSEKCDHSVVSPTSFCYLWKSPKFTEQYFPKAIKSGCCVFFFLKLGTLWLQIWIPQKFCLSTTI